MRRLCSIILALALLGWEAWVAAQAVFSPHVSQFYTQFYIQNTRSCWLPEAALGGVEAGLRVRAVAIAPLAPAPRCFLLMSGWTHDEPWGVWSSKRVARLDVPVVVGAKFLVLRLVAVGPAQVVDVLPGPRVVLGPGETDVRLPVSGTGDMVITLRPEGLFTKHGVGLLGVLWQ